MLRTALKRLQKVGNSFISRRAAARVCPASQKLNAEVSYNNRVHEMSAGMDPSYDISAVKKAQIARMRAEIDLQRTLERSASDKLNSYSR